MDLPDILDLLVDPAFDLLLCRGKLGVWFKKQCTSIFLLIVSAFSLDNLISAIHNGALVSIVIFGILTVALIIVNFRYIDWWCKAGRFGEEFPLLDVLPLPKGDLNNTPPEDSPFGRKSEPSVWDQMGVNK